MTQTFRLLSLVLGLVWAQSAAADPSVKDLAARTELHPIETLTLSTRQFLTGDKSAKAVTIAGELRFPQGAGGQLPAVILQHGSGGPNARDELWAKTFNEMGIASFLVDSFSGRGIVSTSTNQACSDRPGSCPHRFALSGRSRPRWRQQPGLARAFASSEEKRRSQLPWARSERNQGMVEIDGGAGKPPGAAHETAGGRVGTRQTP